MKRKRMEKIFKVKKKRKKNEAKKKKLSGKRKE